MSEPCTVLECSIVKLMARLRYELAFDASVKKYLRASNDVCTCTYRRKPMAQLALRRAERREIIQMANSGKRYERFALQRATIRV